MIGDLLPVNALCNPLSIYPRNQFGLEKSGVTR